MKKIIWLLLIVFLLKCNIIYSQKENREDNLYSKDNILLGKKIDIIKNCANTYFENNKNLKLSDKSDTFKNKYDFCECYVTTIANNFTSNEINGFNDGSLNFEQEYLKRNDTILNSALLKCTKLIAKNIDGDSNMKSFGIEDCVKYYNNFHKDLGKEIDFQVFCECVNKKENSLDIKTTINEINDSNSVIRNELLIDCANKSKISNLSNNEINHNDVLSNFNYENIPIIQNNKLNKIKISFGKISKYFTIDSGATDSSISVILEKELLLQGVIKKQNYIEDGFYEIADGKVIRCKKVKLNNVKIGNFIVNNVTISIRKTGVDLLLGNSFFSKFKNWTINNNEHILYLEKN